MNKTVISYLAMSFIIFGFLKAQDVSTVDYTPGDETDRNEQRKARVYNYGRYQNNLLPDRYFSQIPVDRSNPEDTIVVDDKGNRVVDDAGNLNLGKTQSDRHIAADRISKAYLNNDEQYSINDDMEKAPRISNKYSIRAGRKLKQQFVEE